MSFFATLFQRFPSSPISSMDSLLLGNVCKLRKLKIIYFLSSSLIVVLLQITDMLITETKNVNFERRLFNLLTYKVYHIKTAFKLSLNLSIADPK